MKEINYWKQFLATGKIEDYLEYRARESRAGREEGSGVSGMGRTECASFPDSSLDERAYGQRAAYAGLGGSDGACAEGRADRGI